MNPFWDDNVKEEDSRIPIKSHVFIAQFFYEPLTPAKCQRLRPLLLDDNSSSNRGTPGYGQVVEVNARLLPRQVDGLFVVG